MSLGHRSIGPQSALEWSLNDKLKLSEELLLKLKHIAGDELQSCDGSASAKRITWLRVKRKTKALRKKLAEVHSELPRRLDQLEHHRIRIELNHLMAGVQRLEYSAEATTQQLARLCDGDETPSEPRFATQQSKTNANVVYQVSQHTPFEPRKNPELIHQNFASSVNLSTESPSQMITYSKSNATTSMLEHVYPPHSLPVPNTTTFKSLIVNANFRGTEPCPMECRCKCHLEKSAVSPLSISGLLGQLFIGYKALPMIPTLCTDSSCQKDKVPTVRISYRFPPWWIRHRLMILRAQYQAWQGPEIALEFPRILPPNAQIFIQTSINGSVEGVKELFSKGLASPKDRRVGDMTTPLLVSVSVQTKSSDTKGLYTPYRTLLPAGIGP